VEPDLMMGEGRSRRDPCWMHCIPAPWLAASEDVRNILNSKMEKLKSYFNRDAEEEDGTNNTNSLLQQMDEASTLSFKQARHKRVEQQQMSLHAEITPSKTHHKFVQVGS
jgi:hypothetical protein